MSIITDLMGVKEGDCFVVGNTGRMFKIENNRIFENIGIDHWEEREKVDRQLERMEAEK